MNSKVYVQPAYILHYRPYRDTSLLLDIFSEDYGYISAIAQGARRTHSMLKGLLQPFTPLLLSWSGKAELMRLTSAEANGLPHDLTGNSLISAFYINELLLRCLHKFDPHPILYQLYHTHLIQLSQTNYVQPLLRLFEKDLLNELGYALTLDICAKTGQAIDAAKYYQFEPGQGLLAVTPEQPISQSLYSGASLLAFARRELIDKQHLRDAKRIMRLALLPIIGDKPLKSRELLLVT